MENGGVLFETERLTAVAAQAGHEPVLQAVYRAAGDYFIPITGAPQPDADAAAREITSCDATPGREVALLLRRDDGEPVGAVGWWEGSPEPEVTLLGMIMVVPDARGAGVAREALRGLERWLAARGARRLRTGVGAHHQERQALLASLGFAPMDQRTHVSMDRGRMMIGLFEKEIGRGARSGGELGAG
jgi:GNAT superfamily N-acetyltransferase